ncbi:MAG: hypothetical protein HOV83_16525 [Catenulispora sp.]|nr:hypothetical protein [Catenulispora sp.]
MTDLRITLASNARALVVPGPPAGQPELWLNSPAVVLRSVAPGGPLDDVPATATDGPPDEKRTVGSEAWLWGDDEVWRFDADSGVLAFATLNLPEVNTDVDLGLREWDQAPAIAGTLRLEQLEDFSRPPTAVRWFDSAGTSLVGWYSPEPPPAQPLHRVTLADRTHLLVAADTVVGWTINDPARYITGEAVPPSVRGTDTDARLPHLLATFFSLVTEENVDKLEEGDSRVRFDLEQLAARLETVGSEGEPRAVEVLAKVRQVLEDFGS